MEYKGRVIVSNQMTGACLLFDSFDHFTAAVNFVYSPEQVKVAERQEDDPAYHLGIVGITPVAGGTPILYYVEACENSPEGINV